MKNYRRIPDLSRSGLLKLSGLRIARVPQSIVISDPYIWPWTSQSTIHIPSYSTRSSCPTRGYSTHSTPSNQNLSIATQQHLYMIDPLSPGSIFFLPPGARVFNRLMEFMRAQQRNYGFQEVVTPLIFKDKLWDISGHSTHYKKDMFKVQAEDHSDSALNEPILEDYSLKPMNCPGHCLIFSRHDHSFKELPIRFSDFAPLHRNESSGALSGLTRVRKFHQDDGHIFCTTSQISSEIQSCLNMLEIVYKVFGLSYRLSLSTRPESFTGDIDTWDVAEANLKQVLDLSGKDWHINEGDGAFYGPKIDVLVKDSSGKEHQTATIQLDFQLPKNFNLKYTADDSTNQVPVLIHRAIFGSLERFMATLIDHYKGKWPFWLNPHQAIIIPVAHRHRQYAYEVHSQLSGVSRYLTTNNEPEKIAERYFQVDVLDQDETVGSRIRRANSLGYAYIVLIGDSEIQKNKVSIRSSTERAVQELSVSEVRQKFIALEDSYS